MWVSYATIAAALAISSTEIRYQIEVGDNAQSDGKFTFSDAEVPEYNIPNNGDGDSTNNIVNTFRYNNGLATPTDNTRSRTVSSGSVVYGDHEEKIVDIDEVPHTATPQDRIGIAGMITVERTKAECTSIAQGHLRRNITSRILELSNDLPPINQGEEWNYFEYIFLLESLQRVDISDSCFHVTAAFVSEYQVKRLSWKPEMYCNLKTIYLNETMGSYLWRPKIRSGFFKAKPISIGDDGDYMLSYDGTLHITPKSVSIYQFYCEFDTTAYPFDHHLCVVDITLYSRMESVHMDSTACYLVRFRNQAQYQLLACDSQVKEMTNKLNPEVHIIYRFLITRNPLYDVLNILLPTLILGNLNVVVFLLPAKLPQKASVTISLILAFFVHLSFVMRNMAPGQQPYLAWYICIVLLVDCVSALLTGILMNTKDIEWAEGCVRLYCNDRGHPRYCVGLSVCQRATSYMY